MAKSAVKGLGGAGALGIGLTFLLNMKNFHKHNWLGEKDYFPTIGFTREQLDKADVLRAENADFDFRMYCNWSEQWFANADENWKTAQKRPWVHWTLYGKKQGTCIVVGAGPSLERDHKQIAAAMMAGIYVIAVDRAFGRLVPLGIRPNLVVCADAQPEVREFIKDIDYRTKGSPSIISHPSVSETMRKNGAEIHWHGYLHPTSLFWNAAYKRYAPWIADVRSGLTVMFSAVDIAFWMGFKQIITVGNDLGWYSMDDAVKDDYDAIEIDPGKFWTIPAFLTMAENLAFLPIRHPDVQWVDISGGLVKNGWIVGALSLNEKAVDAA